MKVKKIKLLVIAILILPIFAIAVFNINTVRAVSGIQDDVEETYTAKCAVCHKPQATKFFDPEKANEEHVEIILKGKKGEKPPYMPGYEKKGMTVEQATALVEYMKQLTTASN